MASNSYKSMHKEATTILTGDFNVLFTDVNATKSQGGKSMFKYKAKVEDGPHEGHVFYGNITVSPESTGAMRMFFGQLAAIGIGEAFFASLADDLTQEQSDELIAREIEGKRAQITVANQPWQGVDRESVTGIKAPGPMTGGVASPMGFTGVVQPTNLGPASTAAAPTSPSPQAGPGPVPPSPSSPPPTPY